VAQEGSATLMADTSLCNYILFAGGDGPKRGLLEQMVAQERLCQYITHQKQ
jgi:hypothetical protein